MIKEKLDKLDLKIINALSQDSRKTTTQIAKEAGSTRPTIIARMKKLQEKQIVDYKTKINLKKLGLKFASLHFKIEKPQEVKQIIAKIKLCPRILQLIQIAGKPTFAALIYVEDAESLLSSIDCLESFLGLKILSYQRVLPLIGETFTLKISIEKFEKTSCGKECGLCLAYQQNECIGCPTTTKYKGPL